tara:strand:+ start:414 stop:599 length:186 start_codon:yes stop_codon:yes gene_type:complete
MKSGFSDIIETGAAETAAEIGGLIGAETALDSTGVGIVLGLALGGAMIGHTVISKRHEIIN